MIDPYAALEIIDLQAKADSQEDLLHEMAICMQRLVKSDGCDILLRDHNDGLVLRASTLSPELTSRLRLGKGVGLCGKALVGNERIYVGENARQHPQYVHYVGLDDHDGDGVAIFPFGAPGRPPMGVMMFGKQDAWPMSVAEIDEIGGVVRVAGAVMEGYESAYQHGAKTNRLGALTEVSKTISASPYLEEILQLLVNLTAQQFNYTVCTVRLLDEHRGELVLRATQAPAKAYQKKRAIKLGESIAGRAIAENRPIIVADVQTEADYIGHDLAVEQGLKSMICVPLTILNKAVGVLSCYTSEVRDFPADEIEALETLAKQAAVSIDHAKLQVRDTLMQEMHHRVKNNLQQVASLLRLQMRHSQYKSLEEALNDVLSRILAIAAVHDLLSREDLDHVGVRSIAETLVQTQQSSLVLPDRSIKFEVRGDDVRLNMTQATQLALVLNELIQNAVEHGFKETAAGEIHVNVEHKEGEVSIWVSNSGDKLPVDFDPGVASHLGLQIVENLARALGGKFTMREVLGWTVCEVRFPRAGEE
jgi:two-component sensor histidine kinase